LVFLLAEQHNDDCSVISAQLIWDFCDIYHFIRFMSLELGRAYLSWVLHVLKGLRQMLLHGWETVAC